MSAAPQPSRWARVELWLGTHGWTLAYALCVLFGAYLRTRGMFVRVIPLWADEALSANELMRERLLQPSVRPLGFMATSLLLARTFGASEIVLRFLPWLCGVASPALAVPLARGLFRAPAIRLLFVAIIAFHPYAIDYSKEFKPYSVSLFIHLCCMYGVVKYWQTLSRRWLTTTAGVAITGVLFAQDILFAYPAIYLGLGFAAWRSRRRHLIPIVAAVTLNLSLLLLLYWLFWRHMSGPQDAGTQKAFGYAQVWWSRGYDLFYIESADESRFAWYLRKCVELVSFPGARRMFWEERGPIAESLLEPLRGVDVAVWVSLHVIALIRIVTERRLRAGALLLLPLLVVAAFNFQKLWPFGPFRTNLFALVYSAALACLALDTRLRATRRSWERLVPVLLLVVLPLLVFERTWGRRKDVAGHSAITSAIESLAGRRDSRTTEPELLVLDGLACSSWRYYANLHPDYKAAFAALDQRFWTRCVRGFRQSPVRYAGSLLKGRPERFWMVVAFSGEISKLKQHAPRGYRIIERRTFGQDDAMVIALQRGG